MRSKHPYGLVIPGDLCTVIDAKDEDAVTGPALMHRSVCDRMDVTERPDLRKHSKANNDAAWDVFSNRIVDTFQSRVPHENGSILYEMRLINAVRMRGNLAGLIVRSDRGSQFRSNATP
ncbi:hypothetical protein JFX23_08340 [Schaalia cardiffensis]|uniref:hypothetical protein n=1 Tax=Schaalia cardiffensis TaxID=181487 RepID=UPI0018E72A4F|nr:hypothetical protein [Schaalia cardiffensis]MBJ2329768.1 hypothetical protein [Schaalia cardiffensis]